MIAVLVLSAVCAVAEDDQAETQPSQPTIAILPLESNLKQPENSGELIGQVLSLRIAAEGQYTMVDRSDLDKVIEEQKIRLSGMVDPDEAAEVGNMLGAHLLITGRIVKDAGQLYLFCKAISVETSELKGFFLTLDSDAQLPQITQKLTSRLTQVLPKWSKALIPEREQQTPLAERLKEILDDRKLGKVAVVTTEEHRGTPIIDPAVQTELTRILKEAGVSLVAVPKASRETVLEGVKDYGRLRQQLDGARYLIHGEAFSENAGQVQGLVAAVARVELQIVDLRTEQVFAADSDTARVPDLAPHLAAKTALKHATTQLADKMLPDWAKALPNADEEQEIGSSDDG